jgi:hypothetical protein
MQARATFGSLECWSRPWEIESFPRTMKLRMPLPKYGMISLLTMSRACSGTGSGLLSGSLRMREFLCHSGAVSESLHDSQTFFVLQGALHPTATGIRRSNSENPKVGKYQWTESLKPVVNNSLWQKVMQTHWK